ncbi:hypothetical protein AXF42_Ash005801 [Apostasia shenzhenica]|uniref:Uncharacterized protein n=1 Tax=Apostasia shenzhenica TaxID=1088818 RepID=A0A2I0BCF1_9ASPA|nr:hypothetical protein AXF42_Ash005801 [Apostasia shenzhenica]
MVARTRRTNSAARSVHAGEPSVRAPGDEASASTSWHRAGSTSSSRDTASQSCRECWQTSPIWLLALQHSRP